MWGLLVKSKTVTSDANEVLMAAVRRRGRSGLDGLVKCLKEEEAYKELVEAIQKGTREKCIYCPHVCYLYTPLRRCKNGHPLPTRLCHRRLHCQVSVKFVSTIVIGSLPSYRATFRITFQPRKCKMF